MHPTSRLRPGELAELLGEARRAAGPSPLPWLAGAAMPAMAVVAAAHRHGTLDHPDPPGSP